MWTNVCNIYQDGEIKTQYINGIARPVNRAYCLFKNPRWGSSTVYEGRAMAETFWIKQAIIENWISHYQIYHPFEWSIIEGAEALNSGKMNT